jgi:hypothetical protein
MRSRRAQSRDRRGLLPGAPRDLRRPAGRHDRRGRRVQLLSRPRISARSATAARSPRDAALADAEAAAQRRPDRRYHHSEFGVNSRLDEMQAAILRARGLIETLIHYPVPIPRQPALASERPADCPVADRVCAEVLSLPLYPALPASRCGRSRPHSGTRRHAAPRATHAALRRDPRVPVLSVRGRLRTWGTSEAAPAFQGLFTGDNRPGIASNPVRVPASPPRNSIPRSASTMPAFATSRISGRSSPAKSESWCLAIRWFCRYR